MSTGEQKAARFEELESGKLKEVDVAGTPVCLARDGERVYATQATCPHYELKLAEGGTIVDGRIRCPWHMSCFAADTGACLEPPAIDALASYPCRVENGDVFVTLGAEPLPKTKRAATSKKTIVIVGTGAGGFSAAQRLCELGFNGRIQLLGDDPSPLPYDRPSLSKSYLTAEKSAAKLGLRDEAFYDERAIERVRGRAVGIDRAARRIKLSDGGRLEYDVAILAPGSTPKVLDVPGGDLARVLTLRNRVDCEQILSTSEKSKSAVIVGSSFIGMEVAAGLRIRGVDVTVVAPSNVPFETTLGEAVGAMFQRAHEKEGVRFFLGRKVARVEGKAMAERVILDDATTLPCDAVIVGVGVAPATNWLGDLGLSKDGGIEVDAAFRTRDASLYAIGDIARPIDPRTNRPMRIEHWRTAMQHGRRAASAIVGRDEPIVDPPYFWSLQYELGLDYVGHADRFDAVRVDGTAADDFYAEYSEAGKVMAIASVGRTERVMTTIEAMRKEWRP